MDNTKEIQLVEMYKKALEEKEKADENAKAAGEVLKDIKKQLIDEMILNEDMDVIHDGLLYSLSYKTKYSKAGDCDEEGFFETLKECGLGDIIKETVNANTLSSAINELAIGNAATLAAIAGVEVTGDIEPVLPEELEPYINEYSYWDVSKPKAPSKTKLKLIEKAQRAKAGM